MRQVSVCVYSTMFYMENANHYECECEWIERERPFYDDNHNVYTVTDFFRIWLLKWSARFVVAIAAAVVCVFHCHCSRCRFWELLAYARCLYLLLFCLPCSLSAFFVGWFLEFVLISKTMIALLISHLHGPFQLLCPSLDFFLQAAVPVILSP